MLNLDRVRELENWLKRTNTKLIQVNGQRKYGGPPEGTVNFKPTLGEIWSMVIVCAVYKLNNLCLCLDPNL